VVSTLKLGPGKRPAPPVWKGPQEDGITFSLLSRFLVDRERFRLLVVEGLRPVPCFEHRLEFGTMWHLCEEGLAACPLAGGQGPAGRQPWQARLLEYARDLCLKYPTQQEQVDHWYNVVKLTFSRYAAYWADHTETSKRTPLLQECVFDVPYPLKGNRVVRLRGKWDSVDLAAGRGAGTVPGLWLQENKSKGQPSERTIRRQLNFDLQTMLYAVAFETARSLYRVGELGGAPAALREALGKAAKHPFQGVRYNVVRRPLGGGKGSIVRHKPTRGNPDGETKASFYKRLGGIIDGDPGSYFMRWDVSLTEQDCVVFKQQCLDPLLAQLCDWWEWVGGPGRKRPFDNKVVFGCEAPVAGHDSKVSTNMVSRDSAIHWRMPYGVYNPLLEGGATDLDECLDTGSRVGLVRTDDLFPELT
jgi:hypothetical protein